MNISVLRTVFDKLAGRDLTRHLTTPKRNFPLPEVLSQEAVRDLLAAATSTRDQLILGLLYGCGLKVGELRTLTWADIDAAVTTLRVRYGRNRQRNLEIPPDLQPAGGESGARHHTGRPAPTREAESASFYRTAKRGSHRTPLPRRDHQLLLPLPEFDQDPYPGPLPVPSPSHHPRRLTDLFSSTGNHASIRKPPVSSNTTPHRSRATRKPPTQP
jgi:integrase